MRFQEFLLLCVALTVQALADETPEVWAPRRLDDDNPDCTRDKIAKHQEDTCSFVREACDGAGSGIIGSYVVLFHCGLGGSGVAFVLICAVLLLVLLSGLGSTADVFFIPQLQ